MKTGFAYIVLFLITSYASAQSKYPGSATYKTNRTSIDEFRVLKEQDGGFIRNEVLNYSEIEGTPYFDPQFKYGTMLIPDGTLLDSCMLRYNVFQDRFEYSSEGAIYEVNPKSKIKRAVYDGHIFAFEQYNEKEKAVEGYLEVLVEGKVVLYKKYTIQFIPPTPSSPYNEARQAKFELPQKSFYISAKKGEISQVISKKVLLGIFGEKKNEMTSFIAKNRLNIKKESDLIKIVLHFNTSLLP